MTESPSHLIVKMQVIGDQGQKALWVGELCLTASARRAEGRASTQPVIATLMAAQRDRCARRDTHAGTTHVRARAALQCDTGVRRGARVSAPARIHPLRVHFAYHFPPVSLPLYSVRLHVLRDGERGWCVLLRASGWRRAAESGCGTPHVALLNG